MEKISDYEEVLSRYFQNDKLVLFLGSGFTVNERSKDSTVLDGISMFNLMIDNLIVSRPGLDRDELEKESFSEIADSFFNNVDEQKIDAILKKHFTGVNISNDEKLNLLKVGWPYVYTLNIDDGIENNSTFKVILPNKETKPTYLNDFRFVYKLHGDAMDAITYKENKSIIFSRGQYLKSLKENKSLLTKLKADYIQSNILFIGCSLQDEIDLRLIIEELRDDESAKTNDLIFLTNKELDENKKMKLESLGINKYITEDFNVFYRNIVSCLQRVKIDKDSDMLRYKNLKFKILINDFRANLQTLYSDYSVTKISDKNVILPFYLISRDVEKSIDKYLERTEPFFYLIGRRCSGKTLLIFSIIKKLANMNSYYFPSQMALSNETVNNLLTLKNTFLVFDSNSLTSEQISRMQNYEDEVRKNRSSVMFIVNASDRIFASLMISYFGDKEIEVCNKFNDKETDAINTKISKCKIANFEKKSTVIDNIIRIESTYGIINKHINTDVITTINDKDLIVLLLLLTYSKLYFSELLLYGISLAEMNKYPSRFNPFVELEDTSLLENSEHSKTKLVSNSTIGLISILNTYYNSNAHAKSRIINAIKRLVVVSVGAESKKYKNVIMYDNLNQIFFYSRFKGARSLILDLYNELESVISFDSHYWIQRAKSIIHMDPENISQMRNAKIYALKAYSDSEIGTRLNTISMFTLARIIGRIIRLDDYVNASEIEESVHFYYKCLIDNHIEDEYSKDMLEEAKKKKNRSDLYHLVVYNPITRLRDYSRKQELTALYNLILKS